MQEALIERNHCLNWKDIKSGFGGICEEFQTYEIRHPLRLAMTGLQNFGSDYQLHEIRPAYGKPEPFFGALKNSVDESLLVNRTDL
jgi:hypothetical protein